MSEERTPSQKCRCEGSFMEWGTGIGCTARTYQANQISFFAGEKRSFSFMDVFGIGIQTVNWLEYRNPDTTSGYRSSRAIARETSGIKKYYRRWTGNTL